MPDDLHREQFLRLFLPCQPRIAGFVRALVFSRADADDIMQETALVLWEKFDEFEPGTHFDRWAYRIAQLQVMYHRQKVARDGLRFSDTVIEQLADNMVADHEHREAMQGLLTHCIGRLPPDDRDLVQRRYRGNGTNRDVAHATGRSESAISRALSRIHTALLLCMEGTMGREEARADR